MPTHPFRSGFAALAVGGLVVLGACTDPSTSASTATRASTPTAPTVPADPGADPALTAPPPTSRPATATTPVATTPTSRPSPTAVPPTTQATLPAPTTVPARPARAPLATPLPVASLTLPLVDDSRPTVSGGELISSTRALTTEVWYPATPVGPWPVVVFAHGFEVGPDPYVALCEAWAAAGYVVAAPAFPLTDADVAGENLDENDIDNQPDDVRFVFASLLEPGSPVAGIVDPDRLAVAGHSDGGETALAVGVAPLPGLRGVIALSASPVYDGTVDSPPLLVVQGNADDINDYADGAAVYDQAAAPRYLLTLLGGGHLPPFLDGSPYLDTVDQVAVDFLDYYVADRTASPAALEADADAQPDLVTLDADP